VLFFSEIYLIDFYKDLIIKHLGINLLLIGALQASNNFAYNTTEEENSSKIDLTFTLVQFALENGAYINFNYSGYNALDLASDKQIIDLLKEYGAISNNVHAEEFYQNDLHYFLWNPQLILEKKYKNLDVEKDLDAKMPSIMHHIWLTHPYDPNEIRPQDIENVIRTKEVFAQGEGIWKHIVWTNDLQLIPASVGKLAESGIEVKSIYHNKDNIPSFELIEELIEQKLWGKASDTLRYSLVEYFGGVYADINYIFDRDVTDETYKYNFFTSTFYLYYLDNYFFAASPHHPVVQKIVSLVARNLLNPPKYLTDISDQESDV
jgi:mannosyltransferase OCH1-like enzyme